jgi:flagellar hook-basal body complex protein FliE
MSLPISSISFPTVSIPTSTAAQAHPPAGVSFQSILHNAVNNVETSRAQANAAVSGYLSGGNQELHSTVLATQNADLNFEMFMQVRNKVVSAYEEMMRMQV